MGRNSRTLIDQSLYADDKDFLLKVGWPYRQCRELIDPGTYVAMCKLDHLFDPKPTTSLQILDGSNQWLCPRCDRKVTEGHGWRTFPLVFFHQKAHPKPQDSGEWYCWCLMEIWKILFVQVFLYAKIYDVLCRRQAVPFRFVLPSKCHYICSNPGWHSLPNCLLMEVCAQGMPKTKLAISRCDLEWVWKRFAQEKLFELKSKDSKTTRQFEKVRFSEWGILIKLPIIRPKLDA